MWTLDDVDADELVDGYSTFELVAVETRWSWVGDVPVVESVVWEVSR